MFVIVIPFCAITNGYPPVLVKTSVAVTFWLPVAWAEPKFSVVGDPRELATFKVIGVTPVPIKVQFTVDWFGSLDCISSAVS